MSGPLVLAVGDSLTAGYGLAPADAFPAQLERALADRWPGLRVANAGRSGDTAAAGLARLPALLSGLRVRPDLAVVALGANDLLRGVDPVRTRANLDAILHLFAGARIPALLVGLAAPAWLGARVAAFNAVHPAVARAHRVALHTLDLAGVVGDPALTLADRLHPNGRAVGLAVGRMLPLVEQALQQALDKAA